MSHDRETFKATVDMTGVGTIAIGDHDIANLVSGFEVKCDAQKVNKVTIHLLAPQLELDIESPEIPQIESEWADWSLQRVVEWIGYGPPLPSSVQLNILHMVLNYLKPQLIVSKSEQPDEQ